MKHAMRSVLIFALLLLAPALLAQRGGMGVAGGASMAGAPRGSSGHGFGFRRATIGPGVVGGFHHRGFHKRRFISPFWNNAFWWDDGYPDQTQVEVQPPAAPAPTPEPRPVEEVKPANPLLIELQGDRFVRLTGNPPVSFGSSQSPPRSELTPAILVFRDGNQQEVASYAIIGPALYVSGSYWTSGYWTRKILLADLDLPATLRANQQRGVNFTLPSAPDQVVTRP